MIHFGADLSSFRTNHSISSSQVLHTQNYPQNILHTLSHQNLTSSYCSGKERSVSAPADMFNNNFGLIHSEMFSPASNVKYNCHIQENPNISPTNPGESNKIIPKENTDGTLQATMSQNNQTPTNQHNGNEPPFSVLAKPERNNVDGHDDNVSINELVVMEYATQRHKGKQAPNQEFGIPAIQNTTNPILNKTVKDGKILFPTFINIPSSSPASTGLLNGGKKNRISASINDFKSEVRSTIKTLALILMYLLISLPSYITATIHRNCYCQVDDDGTNHADDLQNCKELRQYMYVFSNLSLVGHIAFPCTWLFFDKMYTDKLLKTLRIVRDTH